MTIDQIDMILQFVIFAIAVLGIAYLCRDDVRSNFLEVFMFIFNGCGTFAAIIVIIKLLTHGSAFSSLLFPILFASLLLLLNIVVIICNISNNSLFSKLVNTWEYDRMKKSYDSIIKERDLLKNKYDLALSANTDLVTSLEKLKHQTVSQEKIINKNKIQFV